jgi:hypothetical protein
MFLDLSKENCSMVQNKRKRISSPLTVFLFAYRAIAPDLMDSDFLGLQTLRHLMRMTRTWDSTMSMIPKGGDTIWGSLDWSPEDGFECKAKKQKNNDSEVSKDVNGENVKVQPEPVNYGRLVSFGKEVAEAPSSEIEQIEFRVSIQKHVNILCLLLGVVPSSTTCQCFLYWCTCSHYVDIHSASDLFSKHIHYLVIHQYVKVQPI